MVRVMGERLNGGGSKSGMSCSLPSFSSCGTHSSVFLVVGGGLEMLAS